MGSTRNKAQSHKEPGPTQGCVEDRIKKNINSNISAMSSATRCSPKYQSTYKCVATIIVTANSSWRKATTTTMMMAPITKAPQEASSVPNTPPNSRANTIAVSGKTAEIDKYLPLLFSKVFLSTTLLFIITLSLSHVCRTLKAEPL